MTGIITPTYKRPVDYSKSRYTLYTAAGGKRASLVMIGASVNWGYGLDQTETYAYLMQKAIDTYVGKNMGGWVGRYIHTDDWQTGGTAAGGTPSYYPYNGSSAASGWSAGINNPSSYSTDSYGTPVPFAPAAALYATVRRSKLNWNDFNGTVPGSADCGIFGGNTYSGDKNATFTNGGVYLDSTNTGSLRWAVNFTKNATAYVYFRITEIAGSAIQLQLYGTNDNGSSAWTIPNSGYASPPNSGIIGLTANQSTDILMAPQVNNTTINPIQQMTLTYYGGSGRALIEVIQPLNGVQASNHILVQICSRNSYCLQDYASTNTYVSSGTGVRQRNTVEGSGNSGTKRSCVTQIVNGVANKYDGSANTYPFYVLGDTYNSMVTQWQNGSWYDKRLTPSQYGNQLDLIGKDLLSTTGGGQIILTLPIRTQTTSLGLLTASAGATPTWNGYTMRDSNNSGNYDWGDYWQAIYNLAAARGWGFVDQGQIDCISHTGSYYSDCASINSTWTDPTTHYYQNDGLHPSPYMTGGRAAGSASSTIANAFITQLGLSGGS